MNDDYIVENIAFSTNDLEVLEKGFVNLEEGSFCGYFCMPICSFCIGVKQAPED